MTFNRVYTDSFTIKDSCINCDQRRAEARDNRAQKSQDVICLRSFVQAVVVIVYSRDPGSA